jgi:hypothetical protein
VGRVPCLGRSCCWFLNKFEAEIFAHMHESFQWLPPSTRGQGGEGLLQCISTRERGVSDGESKVMNACMHG